jgi:hypothetical protein
MLVRILHSTTLVIADGFRTIIAEKRWGLLPAFILFLLLALLLIVVKAVSPIAPFVYSLF